MLIGAAVFVRICGICTSPGRTVSIGAKPKLPSGVRSEPAVSIEKKLFVPRKSFDCLTATCQSADAQPVMRPGWAVPLASMVPPCATALEDDRNSMTPAASTVAVQPARAVLAAVTWKPAGGVMFADANVWFDLGSFARLTVNVLRLTV